MEEKKDVQENVIKNNNTNEIKTVNEVNNNNNNQPTKNNNGVITVLIVIIILLCIGLIYMLFFYNNEETNNKPKDNEIRENENKENNGNNNEIANDENGNQTKNTNEEKKDDNTTKKYELTVYKSKEDGELCISDRCSTLNDYVVAFKIPVNSENSKLVDYTMNKFVLYDDNGIKIYDVKNKSIKSTQLEASYSNFVMYLNDDYTKVIGIKYSNNNKEGYYNVVKNLKLYENNYNVDDLVQINNDYLSIDLKNDSVTYLASSNEEKILLKSPKNTEDNGYSFGSIKVNNGYIITLNAWHYEDREIVKLYNDKLKEFYSESLYEGNYSTKDNFIYINENNKVKKYDVSGNLLFTSNNYSDIKYIINNYVVYVKDNNLILENIDDINENKILTKWNSEWYIHYMSGYYTRDALDMMEESHKKEGLYVVVEYPNKDSNGNYAMEYCYTSDKQIIEYPNKQGLGGRAKPVLYLYPEKDMNVKVELEKPSYLTTTYPKYYNSWNVFAKTNGDLYDNDGKYYYALYWDEKRYHEVDFSEGFYVEKKDAITFLEEKLAIIGLNDRERNEFIMYWLPIMEKNEKNLVYFELTEEREANNKLLITPKPDSLLRVSIHIKKVNEKVNIKEEKLESFNRHGFTAVEWGGMEY